MVVCISKFGHNLIPEEIRSFSVHILVLSEKALTQFCLGTKTYLNATSGNIIYIGKLLGPRSLSHKYSDHTSDSTLVMR